MKPKTKFQKTAYRLSQKLKPISEKQKRWAEENCFYKFYIVSRNRHHCLECGHKWNKENANSLVDAVLDNQCPSCKEKSLKKASHFTGDATVVEYYAKFQVIEGYQLIRMFMIEKIMRRKKPAQYFHHEIMNHFINSDGKIESLQKLRNNSYFNAYENSWATGTDMLPRSKSATYYQRLQVSPTKILPGRRTLKIIRRNGYKGYFKTVPPVLFLSAILRHPECETLLKSKKYELFDYAINNDGSLNDNITTYWPIIRIAIRNHFVVRDPRSWFDYLRLLDHFGKDLHNHQYSCPTNFSEQHNRYVAKRQDQINREEKERLAAKLQEQEAWYKEHKAHFNHLHFREGNIEIVPFKTVEQVLEEGNKLHHCIYTSRYWKREDSLILSARVNGKVTETIEVDLQKGKVVQSRGLQNGYTEHHSKIIAVVSKHMQEILRCENRKNITEMYQIEKEVA